MKEFDNARELFGQIGLDLESKAGKVGNLFRKNIRKELRGLGDKKTVNISIKQTRTGSVVSMKIEDWVDKLERTRITEEFKDLMERLGASKSGICVGDVPGSLMAFLR